MFKYDVGSKQIKILSTIAFENHQFLRFSLFNNKPTDKILNPSKPMHDNMPPKTLHHCSFIGKYSENLYLLSASKNQLIANKDYANYVQ